MAPDATCDRYEALAALLFLAGIGSSLFAFCIASIKPSFWFYMSAIGIAVAVLAYASAWAALRAGGGA